MQEFPTLSGKKPAPSLAAESVMEAVAAKGLARRIFAVAILPAILLTLLTLLTLALTSTAQASELRGQVVSISDGDTLTIVAANPQQQQQHYRIRLSEIDAPETHQPFGRQSKQSLVDLCYGRGAIIQTSRRDRHGRIIGRVRCAGVDVNAEQVRRGMAWVFNSRNTDRNTDRNLQTLQSEARKSQRGLWLDRQPMPPWEYRAEN